MMTNAGHKAGIMLSLAVALLAAPVQAAESEIVFINLERAFSEFYKTKMADEQLKKQAEEFNAERKKLTEEYEKLQGEFSALREEAQNPALNEEARALKRTAAEDKVAEIRDMETRIRRFDEARQKQLDDQTRRMRKRIVEEIRQVIQDHARKQNYRAVVDASGQSFNAVEVVLYLDNRNDITDTVVELLNKGQKHTSP